MAAALPFLMVAGSAATGVSQIMQGQAQSDAAKFEQQQYTIQEQQTRTAAEQAEAQRREELVSNIETIQTIRGGRNVGSHSPTGMAILDDTIADAQRELLTERSNYLTKADLASRAAEMSGRRAQTSLLAGYLGAASTAGQTAGKFYGAGRV